MLQVMIVAEFGMVCGTVSCVAPRYLVWHLS